VGTVWHNLWHNLWHILWHNLRRMIPDQFPHVVENGGIALVWAPQVAKLVGERGFPTN